MVLAIILTILPDLLTFFFHFIFNRKYLKFKHIQGFLYTTYSENNRANEKKIEIIIKLNADRDKKKT